MMWRRASVASTEIQIRDALLCGFANVSVLSKIRHVALEVNQTTRTNADTRLNPKDYYGGNPNQEIVGHELGCGGVLTILWNI